MRAHTKPVGFACGISEKVRAPQRARARVKVSALWGCRRRLRGLVRGRSEVTQSAAPRLSWTSRRNTPR